MAELSERNQDTAAAKRLKARARLHGRSLQREVKAILEATAIYSMDEARGVAKQWQRRLAGNAYRHSAETIREDRER